MMGLNEFETSGACSLLGQLKHTLPKSMPTPCCVNPALTVRSHPAGTKPYIPVVPSYMLAVIHIHQPPLSDAWRGGGL